MRIRTPPAGRTSSRPLEDRFRSFRTCLVSGCHRTSNFRFRKSSRKRLLWREGGARRLFSSATRPTRLPTRRALMLSNRGGPPKPKSVIPPLSRVAAHELYQAPPLSHREAAASQRDDDVAGSPSHRVRHPVSIPRPLELRFALPPCPCPLLLLLTQTSPDRTRLHRRRRLK